MPNFARFVREKPDSWSGKPDTRSRNLFVLKHIWVKVSITCKFQPNWSKNTLKSRFFWISGKTGSRIQNFLGLKPSPDQDGANKKRISQIGPAVPELWRHTHTDRQKPLLLCSIDIIQYQSIYRVSHNTTWFFSLMSMSTSSYDYDEASCMLFEIEQYKWCPIKLHFFLNGWL